MFLLQGVSCSVTTVQGQRLMINSWEQVIHILLSHHRTPDFHLGFTPSSPPISECSCCHLEDIETEAGQTEMKYVPSCSYLLPCPRLKSHCSQCGACFTIDFQL